MKNTFKVGDILHASWNCTMHYPYFFIVTKVTPKKVGIARLNKRMTENLDGYGQQCMEIPEIPQNLDGLVSRLKNVVELSNGNLAVNVDPASNAMSYAVLWDGEPKYADYLD